MRSTPQPLPSTHLCKHKDKTLETIYINVGVCALPGTSQTMPESARCVRGCHRSLQPVVTLYPETIFGSLVWFHQMLIYFAFKLNYLNVNVCVCVCVFVVLLNFYNSYCGFFFKSIQVNQLNRIDKWDRNVKYFVETTHQPHSQQCGFSINCIIYIYIYLHDNRTTIKIHNRMKCNESSV